MKPNGQTLCAIKQREYKFLGITIWTRTTYIEESFADMFLRVLNSLEDDPDA